MNVSFSGHDFLLHPSGVLFWPEEKLAIVSDLHLEKGSHFAKKGYFLPPYDTRKTLIRLMNVLEVLKPSRVLILGDCFHDPKGYSRLPEIDRLIFNKLKIYTPVWIMGNHDGDFIPEGFAGHETYALKNITFRHEAAIGASNEISGHFHPKAEFVHKGGYISRPCFFKSLEKIILPAFGAYTGGIPLNDPVFLPFMSSQAQAYLLGEQKIYRYEIQQQSEN